MRLGAEEVGHESDYEGGVSKCGDALLTAAAERLPPAILDQIKPGGRIVLPLGPDEAQRLTVVDKGADGQTSVRELIRVRFSRLETVV